MPLALLGLLRSPWLVLFTAAALAGWFLWADRQALLARLQAAQAAQAAAVAAAQGAQAELAQARRGLAAVADEHRRASARAANLNRELREVENARDTVDDGDVAPVLRGVFDRLRRDWRAEHGLPAPERAP